MSKKQFIWDLSKSLHSNKKFMTISELAIELNNNGYQTNYNTAFQGKRGTYKLVKETWKWVNNELKLPNEADKIAVSFIKPDGSYAYK